jgi:hypothetical protein
MYVGDVTSGNHLQHWADFYVAEILPLHKEPACLKKVGDFI